MNLFHNDELKSNIITLTLYCICTKMCSKNNVIGGNLGYNFSTVAIHLLTLLCVCVNF